MEPANPCRACTIKYLPIVLGVEPPADPDGYVAIRHDDDGQDHIITKFAARLGIGGTLCGKQVIAT